MSHGYLFVYGSMTKGMVHYNRLASFVEGLAEANTRGSVFRLEVGFPAFLTEGDSVVPGQLLELRDFDALIRILDEMHGYSLKTPEKSLFLRSEISVETESGKQMAWVYSMNPSKLPKSAIRIEDGDWRRSISESEPLTVGLSRNQKVYIQKLGRSSGRDIVPINLDLYRELMNQGLIVDKGRRLALTSLGQECFYFIEDQP